MDQELQLPIESEEIFKRSESYDQTGKFLQSEVNGKKHLILSAKAALHNSANLKLFNSKPSVDSRFKSTCIYARQSV
ncbi:hypothetical protein L1987_84467 [Smallanthus sonchifolius]|uniref:Uncharacterized protein n=1 Tax=Smallanthus sonchifolius TaxID=185202 RepID=A0ACB8YFH7_9ASTR|nr:hypothetical protein L1987_84467 [Smallanthus sonchifolius]